MKEKLPRKKSLQGEEKKTPATSAGDGLQTPSIDHEDTAQDAKGTDADKSGEKNPPATSVGDGLVYGEWELAKALRINYAEMAPARERALVGVDDAGYVPDARLSRIGARQVLQELGFQIDISLSEARAGGHGWHTLRCVTCTVNPRIMTAVHMQSGRMVRAVTPDNRRFVPGMEFPARFRQEDVYDAIALPKARGRW